MQLVPSLLRRPTEQSANDPPIAPASVVISGRRSFQRVAPGLAVGVLVALTLLVFERHLFDHWTFPWDFLGAYTTIPAFVAATIGRGHPLSWSPFVASGFPVDINPQSGLYFPGWWLLGALQVPLTLRVLTAVQISHVLFGALGVLVLARVRALEWSWATVAAVAYLFFGGFYGQAEHADIIRGFAYLPWLLWALTPPPEARRWARLVALPLLTWLIVTGAYPGEIVSFGIAGLVYLIVALRVEGMQAWRRHRGALALAVLACAAVCVTVLLPYVRAEQANELYRTIEPTAAVRATFAIRPVDLFGLYLNNFAWTYEGTVTAWAVGVPILIGLACARRATLARHAPLVACGAVALALGMAPKIGFIGHAMASLRPLFPSRFPSSDYKAVVAVALVVVAADAWSSLAAPGRARPWKSMVLAGGVLVVGALLVPRTYGQPTRELWLVIAVIMVAVACALLRPPARVLVCLLVVLIVVDGAREVSDYRLGGAVSPWQVPPSALAFYRQRDGYVRELPGRLERTVVSRPARVPAALTAEPNASGWLGDAYHETDYDSTIERVLWEAEQNPVWSALLLAPWHAYTFPCAAVGCSSSALHLPLASTWRPSADVRTVSYGTQDIVYSVNLAQPVLMVENELAIKGWQTNSNQVQIVKASIPLRVWRLSAGHYQFTASYHESGRSPQELALLAALLAWLGCVLLVWRKPKLRFRRTAV